MSQSGVVHRKNVDISPLGYDKITMSTSFTHLNIQTSTNSSETQIHNKIDYNFLLSNKKALFYNLKQYYTALGHNHFDYIPVSFHIVGETDKEFDNFVEYFSLIRETQGTL